MLSHIPEDSKSALYTGTSCQSYLLSTFWSLHFGYFFPMKNHNLQGYATSEVASWAFTGNLQYCQGCLKLNWMSIFKSKIYSCLFFTLLYYYYYYVNSKYCVIKKWIPSSDRKTQREREGEKGDRQKIWNRFPLSWKHVDLSMICTSCFLRAPAVILKRENGLQGKK